jgi:plastocyanin
VAQLPPGGTFTDDDGNEHEGFIEAIAAAGITLGCNPEGTLYCPAEPVRRDQMASFLARGFDLPAAGEDFFPDDAGNTHEDNINRVAAAGITLGFDDGTFGPTLLVSRAQMASFLARAMGLDPVPGDRFDDVSGVHEGNINAIAEEGVTLGCDEAGTLFCPDDSVRRDQMASFLGRALGLEPTPPPGTSSTSSSSTSSSSSSSSSSTSTTMGEPVVISIEAIVDFGETTVPVGTEVVWENNHNVNHSSTSGTPPNNLSGIWNSGILNAGEDFSRTFNTVGSFDYFCTVHDDLMTGTITVED